MLISQLETHSVKRIEGAVENETIEAHTVYLADEASLKDCTVRAKRLVSSSNKSIEGCELEIRDLLQTYDTHVTHCRIRSSADLRVANCQLLSCHIKVETTTDLLGSVYLYCSTMQGGSIHTDELNLTQSVLTKCQLYIRSFRMHLSHLENTHLYAEEPVTELTVESSTLNGGNITLKDVDRVWLRRSLVQPSEFTYDAIKTLFLKDAVFSPLQVCTTAGIHRRISYSIFTRNGEPCIWTSRRQATLQTLPDDPSHDSGIDEHLKRLAESLSD